MHFGLYTPLCPSIAPLGYRGIPKPSGGIGAKQLCPPSSALGGKVGSDADMYLVTVCKSHCANPKG